MVGAETILATADHISREFHPHRVILSGSHGSWDAQEHSKGFLAWHGIAFKQAHDLVDLVIQCSVVNARVRDLNLDAGELTSNAVRVRCPSLLDDPNRDNTKTTLSAVNCIRSRGRTELNI